MLSWVTEHCSQCSVSQIKAPPDEISHEPDVFKIAIKGLLACKGGMICKVTVEMLQPRKEGGGVGGGINPKSGSEKAGSKLGAFGTSKVGAVVTGARGAGEDCGVGAGDGPGIGGITGITSAPLSVKNRPSIVSLEMIFPIKNVPVIEWIEGVVGPGHV